MSFFRHLFIISLYASLGAYRLFSGETPDLTGAAVTSPHREKIRWLVQKTSTLSIAGSTNVNRFCCRVIEYTGPDTIVSVKEAGAISAAVPLRGVLCINIADFNCSNRIMTAEFKKTLKYHQYPQLKILFVSLEKMPSFGIEAESIKGCVEVELAGVCRKFEISYSSCRTGDAEMDLVGSRTFGFSDFGLTPPRKMGGLVRVNDRLDVEFRLHLRPIY